MFNTSAIIRLLALSLIILSASLGVSARLRRHLTVLLATRGPRVCAFLIRALEALSWGSQSLATSLKEAAPGWKPAPKTPAPQVVQRPQLPAPIKDKEYYRAKPSLNSRRGWKHKRP